MNKVILRLIGLVVMICFVSMSFVACSKNPPSSNKPSAGKTSAPDTSTDKNPSEGNKTATSTATSTGTSQNTVDPKDPFKNAGKKRVKAKGFYLTATSAGARLKHYIDLANTTEINSYVIDYKNDYGNVYANSEVPLAKEIGAVEVQYDAEKVTKELHDNNIYAIARIVCFKDPILSKVKPEYAIKDLNGNLYIHNQMTWVNPYYKKAWDYNIELAKEAFKKGFDEVQFDYIRFPDGKKSNMVFEGKTEQKLQEVINEFLAYARKQLEGQVISGDVFAIICESPGDTEGIGQNFELIGKDLDYLCPMAYPSHYAFGQMINGVKFAKPDFEPYNLIKQTFLKAKSRLEKVDGHKPILRAYLQDFSATWIGAGNFQYYEDEQIRQQIQGLYDAGYEEWFLWDPMNNYREGALKKE